jgi:hypothetical protein
MGKKKTGKPKVIPVSDGRRRYQIKGSDLDHNGKRYRENFFIELSPEEAEPLKDILVLKKKK